MWRVRSRRSVLSLILTLSVVGVSAKAETSRAVANPARTTTIAAAASVGTVPLFVHYYLWWDAHHWRSKLGPIYPMNASTLPVPASLSSDGCRASTPFHGDTLTDIPARSVGLYSQDDPTTFSRQVAEASNAGINGFVVSWAGTGQPTQTANSAKFNHRLAALAHAVAAHNATSRTPFALMLGYEGLNNNRKPRPASWVSNDLRYFARTYAANPIFHVRAYGTKPVIVFLDSNKYSTTTLHTIVGPLRSKLTVIGDEHGIVQWNRGVSNVFDGDSWYWSAENPYTNPGAFTQLRALSATLHAEHKLWFSPLSAGYNRSDFGLGGTCVPRRGLQTLQRLYAGNATSRPDGWMFISWNEFLENTYIEPSVRYGNSYLNALHTL
jgi:hypothetical protein